MTTPMPTDAQIAAGLATTREADQKTRLDRVAPWVLLGLLLLAPWVLVGPGVWGAVR